MGLKLAGIMFVIMCVMGGGFYWYYADTQSRMATLHENNSKLEVAVEINEETIASMKREYAAVVEENIRINDEYTIIRRQNNRLTAKLMDHDLGLLAATKPELIERLVNAGTKNAARCFELLSGAELTKDERNAKSAESFNNECPWLWSSTNANGMRTKSATD